jgi:hypothetical protein
MLADPASAALLALAPLAVVRAEDLPVAVPPHFTAALGVAAAAAAAAALVCSRQLRRAVLLAEAIIAGHGGVGAQLARNQGGGSETSENLCAPAHCSSSSGVERALCGGGAAAVCSPHSAHALVECQNVRWVSGGKRLAAKHSEGSLNVRVQGSDLQLVGARRSRAERTPAVNVVHCLPVDAHSTSAVPVPKQQPGTAAFGFLARPHPAAPAAAEL